MIAFKHSALLHAPVGKVFGIVADPARIPEWRKDVPRVSGMSGPVMAGTTFYEDVHFMGSKRLLMMIVELVPNERLVIEAQSGMPLLPVQTFTFVPEDGGTRLTVSVLMKSSGFLTMMEFMLPAQLKKMWERNLAELELLLAA
ncbi:MAG TPA: SRPBCC family protein [Bacteroidota bacterium]|nr:SRPBCC family protein [Bacteroidota bacterium]